MIRILIVDDHTFFRRTISGIVREADGMTVVGECTDGVDAATEAQLVQPDVVLMDLQMPKMSGTEATRRLMETMPATRVIILSGTLNTRTISQAAQAGAVGYIRKDGDSGRLLDAVRMVAAGGTAWPAQAMSYGDPPRRERLNRV